jgi:drug/metabolite transporter superfamily protein YnfA
MTMFYLTFFIFAVAQIGDAWSTWLVVSNNRGVESNPIVRLVIEKMGLIPGLAVTKVILVAFVYLVFFVLFPGLGYSQYLMLFLALVSAWVVWHNYQIYVKGAPDANP